MQSAVFLNHKHADFTLGTRPIPKVNAGEILIKIKASALNQVEWKIQKWGIMVEEYPAVLGSDVAGEVIAIGEGVTRFSVGDRAFGSALPYPDYAGFQEYCKLKEDFSAKIPPALSYEEASTLPCTLMAAYLGLYNDAPHGMALTPLVLNGRDKYKGEAILIIGGGSSVGQFAIELAKGSGFSPIITTASLKHTTKLLALGATHVIDRTIPLNTIQTKIAEILGSINNLKHIFDAISESETQKASYDLLPPGGKLALVLPTQIPGDSKDKTVSSTFGFPDVPSNSACMKTMYTGIESLIQDGILKPSEIEIVPGGLGGIGEGLKRLENNRVSGMKLVVRLSND